MKDKASKPKPKNLRYPGRPNYKGKTEGWFTLLHHRGSLIEWSDDVMERIRFIRNEKLSDEKEIRLSHIVYVPKRMFPPRLAKAEATCDKMEAAYDKADAAYDKAETAFDKAETAFDKADGARDKADVVRDDARSASREAADACDKNKALLAYLRKHVKDCRWDGERIVFPSYDCTHT